MEQACLAFCAQIGRLGDVKRLHVDGSTRLAVDTLVGWCDLHTTPAPVLEGAARALWIVSVHEEAGQYLLESTVGADRLLALCRKYGAEDVPALAVEMAAATLNNLACLPAGTDTLLDLGAVEEMMRLAQHVGVDGGEQKVGRAAISTLWVLCLDTRAQGQLAAAQGLRAMLTHCRRSTDSKVLEYAAGILRILTLGEPGRERRTQLSDVGGAPTLVKLANETLDMATLEQVLGCLGNLAEDAFSREELGDTGAVHAMLRILSPLKPGSGANRTGRLLPLSGSTPRLPPVRPGGSQTSARGSGGGAGGRRPGSEATGPESGPALLEATLFRPSVVLEAAACTLSILLLKSLENQDRFLVAKGVDKLVVLAHSTSNQSLLAQIAAVFDSVTDNNADGQQTLMGDGGLEAVLEAMSRCDDPDVLLQGCKVVRNLLQGQHDVVGKGQGLKFDVPGLLKHAASLGTAPVKQEAALALKAIDMARAQRLRRATQVQSRRADGLAAGLASA